MKNSTDLSYECREYLEEIDKWSDYELVDGTVDDMAERVIDSYMRGYIPLKELKVIFDRCEKMGIDMSEYFDLDAEEDDNEGF